VGGKTRHPVQLAQGLILIARQGKRQFVIGGELLCRRKVLIHIDTDYLKTRLPMALPQLRQIGHLLTTGYAPGGPECQVDNFAPIVMQ